MKSNGLKASNSSMHDITGKLLYEEQWTESEQLFYAFEGNDLKQGAFVLRLVTDEESYSFKIIRLWN